MSDPSVTDWLGVAVALGGFIVVLLAAAGGWAIARFKGESALTEAQKAHARADAAHEALAAFKLDVAREYASTKSLELVEARVVSAIERLGDRLDGMAPAMIEALAGFAARNTPPAPRARRPKARP